ncbi:MAG TPA: hypothetical protein VLB44_07505 [Kofleriaceae bacterium]|nr:hypothetical protein [Kofleriaceae bacterium]
MARWMMVTMAGLALGGCGDNLVAPAPPDAGIEQQYLPWKVGAVWSYKLTDPTGRFPPATGKLTRIIDERDVGGLHAGKRAFFTHSEQLVGSKDVYQAREGDLEIRYQSVFYDVAGTRIRTDVDMPFRLKLDETAAHTITGARWTTSFTEISTEVGRAPVTTSKTEQWHVVNGSESITVTAGTFDDALHIQRVKGSSGTVQDYWYVRGVGKVKETGGEQTEELLWFTLGD